MTIRRCKLTSGLQLVLLLMVSGSAHAGWWQDLWQTPHQQASTLLQQQDYDQLKRMADGNWQGIGHYHAGEHQQAAERFAEQENLDARYNEATALTHAGDYDRALELFDQVLAEDPAHEEAAHNRDIAQQLKELQQQQQQNQNSEGENNEDNHQEPSSSDDNSSQESQENSAGQNSDPSAEQSAEQSEQQNTDEQNADREQESDADEAGTEENQIAETSQGEEEDAEQQSDSAAFEEQPLSEQAQATEQWLRRIPDDPSGLLRRKLQRSHATDYPNIGNSESPW